MWVKICGNTNIDDALTAVEAGADALGFILVPSSPRVVSRKTICEILAVLPPTVITVGVVANEDPDFLKGLVRVCALSALQFHGEESPEEVLALKEKVRVIKTVRIRDESSLKEIPLYRGVDAILLDTYHPHLRGGTGTAFDWTLAVRAKEYRIPLILAGGLDAGNVRSAVAEVQPYGVDVVSGVERSPGKKDPERLRAFITAAKRTEVPPPEIRPSSEL